MKKHLLSLFAMASMVFASSCTSEEIVSQSTGNEVKVTFTTELRNDVKSRAVGDDTEGIDELVFAVYDENHELLPSLTQKVSTNQITLSDVNNEGQRTATINVVLVKGQTYSFAFWAQDKDYTAYRFNETTATVSIEYGQTANNKNADAFFAKINDYTVTGSFEQNVTLKRPFAQVNFLTTDYDLNKAEAAGFEPDQSSIVVQNAATSLNVLTGEVSGDMEAKFELADWIQSETTTIKDANDAEIKFGGSQNATTFKYLATAYFLPTSDVNDVEITASMSAIQSDKSSKAPVELTAPKVKAKRNYRTNIYGNLLTSNGTFYVTVDPGFDGDYSDELEDPTTIVVATVAEANALFEGGKTNVTIQEAPNSAATISLPQTTNNITINFDFEENTTPGDITIEYPAGATEKPANIEVNGDAGDLIINAPQSTVTLNGNYESVESTTANNTLIVPKGVTIGTLTLKQGNAKIYYGVVETIINEGKVAITWLVDSKEQLAQIATDVNAGNSFDDQTIALINDIDLNNEEWTPIGKENTFDGIFDGQNHTISNIKYHTTESDWAIGLFACSNNATFKNFTINNVDFNITITDDDGWGHIGAVVGYASGETTIENVTLTGDVEIISSEDKRGSGRIGGIIGGNYGKFAIKNIIIDVNNGSFVKGSSSIGGVAGQLQGEATFENIESNINVSADVFAAGGIVGIAPTKTSFKNCSTSGNIYVTNATSENNSHRIGGIAGCWDDNVNNALVLENCSYTGKLTSGEVTVFDCDGYVGRGYSAIAEAKVEINNVSYIYKGNSLYLVGNTYQISNANALVQLSTSTIKIKGGESVKLLANIDLTDVEFNGLNAFNPENNNTFDGQGYTVSNWTYEGGASDMGFIKNWVGPIKNVKFENCNLKTNGRSAIVAAKVYGNIENVTVNNCSIEDSYWACGIIAGLYNSGSVSNCKVTNSSVKSNGDTGGIVGVINESAGERKIENCSVSNSTINNTGVYGETYPGGGLVGKFNANGANYKIVNCTVANNKLEGGYVYEKYPANENVVEE